MWASPPLRRGGTSASDVLQFAILSFLSSARERTAIEALPRFVIKNRGRFVTAGGACLAARYRAEPGNEDVFGNLQFSFCNLKFEIPLLTPPRGVRLPG